MFRFLTIALLAGAAIPTVAFAQDGPRIDRGQRGGWRAERPAGNDSPRPDRAPRFERQQRDFTAAPAAPAVQAPPAVAQPDRSGWRNNRASDGQAGGWRGNRGGDGQPGGWRGNRGGDGQRGDWNGNRGWRGNTPVPPSVATPAQPAPQLRDRSMEGALERDRGQRRDWSRNNDGQRNWNGGDNRRDWNRDNDRRGWNRDDGRRDWNDRRYDNDRGWDGNRRWDGNRSARGSWDRGWRSDRRYNWQGYRASNRYAYRWPQYYAPRGWSYGYRRFSIGTTLFAGLFAQDYWIGNPYDYRLPPVDWPYRWVRYYDDALLVDTETGQVVDVIPGIFW